MSQSSAQEQHPHKDGSKTTHSPTRKEAQADRRWFVVDAEGQTLGRMASQIAHVLRGKHKAHWAPHHDHGDFVVVINAEKVRLTGKKEERKVYHRHTGWMGGIVSRTAAQMRAHDGTSLVKKAVWGMMPKGPLGREMYRKLKVVIGAEHPFSAQQPQQLAINERR